MQFLSTIFAIIGLLAEVVVLWVIAQVFGRVGKPTGLSSLRDRAASRLAGSRVNPSRKSIHDRADEGSDADCYLIAVLKGATDNPNLAGEGAVRLPVAGKHSHFIRPQIAPSERGAK